MRPAERHRLRPRQAFELLRSVARAQERRVLEMATEVVDSATNPLLRIPEELAEAARGPPPRPPLGPRRRLTSNQAAPDPLSAGTKGVRPPGPVVVMGIPPIFAALATLNAVPWPAMARAARRSRATPGSVRPHENLSRCGAAPGPGAVPEKVRGLMLGQRPGGNAGTGGLPGLGYLVRPLILTRLWANTRYPHQIAAPCVPSRRERSQP